MIPHLAMHKNWSPIQNTGEVWTLMKKIRQDNNALQISSMHNGERTRLMPAPDVEHVASTMAAKLAEEIGGKVDEISSGTGRFGRYGTAVFSAAKFPYCQIWSLTNEIDFITATYICDIRPSLEEIEDVRQMVLSLNLIVEPSKKSA
ncbi:MAG TPA: hypothetical protein VHX43_19935 [Xanthobacteraceae bacterium]|jgi:hypothetical protein|nr:hypothetical protein [Xanthobacteraceae bacterium]